MPTYKHLALVQRGGQAMIKKQRDRRINTNPSKRQIDNAEMMKWEYMGDGYFTKNNVIGYYTIGGGFETE